AWACDKLKPAALIDLATLTGAVVVTLGRHHAGLFSNDDGLARAALDAGTATGEALWRLPLSKAMDEDLKSAIADIRNCGWGRLPDALDAARFLEGFVAEGVKWAHLDIAGVAEIEDDQRLCPKGATGFGVRLLDHLIRQGFEDTGLRP
ncbi:MAG: leucyl aminopeptidase, partial [Rhodospirillales bacterium]|nr:leucyl aminopeptidase [Rhodospirillales bacterium]